MDQVAPAKNEQPVNPHVVAEGLAALTLSPSSPSPAFQFGSTLGSPSAGYGFKFSPSGDQTVFEFASPASPARLPTKSPLPFSFSFPASPTSPTPSPLDSVPSPLDTADLVPSSPAQEKKKRNQAARPKDSKDTSFFKPPWPTTMVGTASQSTLDRFKVSIQLSNPTVLRLMTCDLELATLISTNSSLTKLEQVRLISLNSTMKSLNLMSCGVTDEGALHLTKTTNLKGINLSCNHLSDQSLNSLLKCTNLSHLYVGSNTAIKGNLLIDRAYQGTEPLQSGPLHKLSLAHNQLGSLLNHLPASLVTINLEYATLSNMKGYAELVRVAELPNLTSVNFNFIPHPINVIEALARHSSLVILSLDTLTPQSLPERAAELLSRSRSISYLTLNSYLISGPAAQWLSRSESLAHLELANAALGPSELTHILHIPYLRYLQLNGLMSTGEGFGLKAFAQNTSVRTLILNRCNIQDLTPFIGNTTLRDLSLTNGLVAQQDWAALAKCTNLRSEPFFPLPSGYARPMCCRLFAPLKMSSLYITGPFGLLQPQPWCENTTLLRFQHAQFDFRDANFGLIGEHDKVRAEATERHGKSAYSFMACCLALGLERSQPWELRSAFGRLPLEVITHIMSLFTPLWAKDSDSRAAGALCLVQQAEKIYEMVRKRQPIVLLERPRSHGKLVFEVRTEKELVGFE